MNKAICYFSMTLDFPEEPVQLKCRGCEVINALLALNLLLQVKEDVVEFGARTASC